MFVEVEEKSLTSAPVRSCNFAVTCKNDVTTDPPTIAWPPVRQRDTSKQLEDDVAMSSAYCGSKTLAPAKLLNDRIHLTTS